jgi:hypothetical protein
MAGLAQRAQADLDLAASLGPGDLMTEADLADELKISGKTLANQRSRRVGPPYLKLSGGIVRYSRRAVRQWLDANTVNQGGAA